MNKNTFLIFLSVLIVLLTISSATAYDFDLFNRADSATVGNNWTENNEAGSTQVRINSSKINLKRHSDVYIYATKHDMNIANKTTFNITFWNVTYTETTAHTAFCFGVLHDGASQFYLGRGHGFCLENGGWLASTKWFDNGVNVENDALILTQSGVSYDIRLERNGAVSSLTVVGSGNPLNGAAVNQSYTGALNSGNHSLTVEMLGTGTGIGQLFIDAITYDELVPSSTPDYLNVSDPYPLHNTQYNSVPMSFNTTVNATYDFNCSAYLNSTINGTRTFSAGQEVYVEFNNSLADGHYNFSLSCYNATGSYLLYNENSSNHTFHLDTVNPIVTWTLPLSTNNSWYNNATSFVTNITISDLNLYSYYLNVSYSANKSITRYYNFTNTSLVTYGVATKEINHSINTTGLNGSFNVWLRVCDGHTKKIISDDYNITYNLGLQEITFNEEATVKAISGINGFSYAYDGDRYNWTVTTPQTRDSLQFTVSSPLGVTIANTQFAGHVVVGEKYWIDFETDDIESVISEATDENTATITLNFGSKRSTFAFKSIGELNCIVQSRNFNVTMPPVFDNTYGEQNVLHNNTLNIDFNCTDPQNDVIEFKDNTTLFDINSTGGIYDNPSLSEYGIYYIGIACSDGRNETNTSFTYIINDTRPTITITDPINRSLDSGVTSTTLTYSAVDNESDSMTYWVYGGITPTSMYLLYNESQTTYTWNGLSNDQTYYWKVLANDSQLSSPFSPISWFKTSFTTGGGTSGGGTSGESGDAGDIISNYNSVDQEIINTIVTTLIDSTSGDPTFDDMLESYQELLDEGIDMTADEFETIFNEANYGEEIPLENADSAGTAGGGGVTITESLPEGTIEIIPSTIYFTERERAKKIILKNTGSETVTPTVISVVDGETRQFIKVRGDLNPIPSLGQIELFATLEGYNLNRDGEAEIVFTFDKYVNRVVEVDISWGGIIEATSMFKSILSAEGFIGAGKFVVTGVIDFFSSPIANTGIPFVVAPIALGALIYGILYLMDAFTILGYGVLVIFFTGITKWLLSYFGV